MHWVYIYTQVYIYIYIPRYDNRLFVLHVLTVLVKGKTSGGGIGLG